jgi:ubiquinone/menaquinone biosynthesis C-methylase UbiE
MRDVKQIYSRVAGIYDVWTHFTELRSLEAALDDAGIRRGDAVLEVAVGTGVAFAEILRRNPVGHNVGVDLTEPMLRRARIKADAAGVRCELLQADAQALPFADGTFDVVMNNNMLGLVPDALIDRILSEMLRVLRPGGRLVVVTMKRPEHLLSKVVYQVGAVWLGGWRDIDVEPSVTSLGFANVRRRIVTQLGIPSEILVGEKPTPRPTDGGAR